jgi:hypothetical protein
MARTRTPKVHLTTLVSLADYEFIPGNPGHCPISNALKTDPDILSPHVTDRQITFSRRSNQTRYTYRTPIDAVRFIHAVDEMLQLNADGTVSRQSGEIPPDFQLVLTDADLMRAVPRMRTNHEEALRQAHSRDDVVRVAGGKVTIEPRTPVGKSKPRSKRLNTVAVEA